jgi:hypothetical protein
MKELRELKMIKINKRFKNKNNNNNSNNNKINMNYSHLNLKVNHYSKPIFISNIQNWPIILLCGDQFRWDC